MKEEINGLVPTENYSSSTFYLSEDWNATELGAKIFIDLVIAEQRRFSQRNRFAADHAECNLRTYTKIFEVLQHTLLGAKMDKLLGMSWFATTDLLFEDCVRISGSWVTGK